MANPLAWAEDQFDASLWGDGSVLGVDFARFNVKNAVLPGRYEAQIYVNNEEKGESDIILLIILPQVGQNYALRLNFKKYWI
ncbi:hypothetical protein CGSHiR3021_02439 [Haemophilus influenzae 22.4-21]|uniref:PapC N-terminal domain-containing protein n=1 Tax=Haemophilus influenzae 22.4-21 TaxID=375063 RepID=A4NZF5_HAEIF|nr:hypothetical protein CGSHiR3021_02439 [Haemophilus influenzae 22.4-21]